MIYFFIHIYNGCLLCTRHWALDSGDTITIEKKATVLAFEVLIPQWKRTDICHKTTNINVKLQPLKHAMPGRAWVKGGSLQQSWPRKAKIRRASRICHQGKDGSTGENIFQAKGTAHAKTLCHDREQCMRTQKVIKRKAACFKGGVGQGEKGGEVNWSIGLYFGKCTLPEVGEQTEAVQGGCWGTTGCAVVQVRDDGGLSQNGNV